MVPHDILYEICRWSLPLYRVASYDRRFHEYMSTRVESLKMYHTKVDPVDGCYKLCGRLHRVDGPAMVGLDGVKNWYLNGKLHRVGGPAITHDFNGGEEVWYHHGKRHRVDGPARIYIESATIITESWYLNGSRHRDGGPAHISYFSREWYRHGERHREDGPAVIDNTGTFEYYIDGIIYKTTYDNNVDSMFL